LQLSAEIYLILSLYTDALLQCCLYCETTLLMVKLGPLKKPKANLLVKRWTFIIPNPAINQNVIYQDPSVVTFVIYK